MITDLRSLPEGEQFDADIAIIGAGAAGMTMARRLSGTRLKVLVLESGGNGLDTAVQDLHAGSQSGLPYFPLHESRYRMLGGSTYRWGSRSAPFQPVDLGPRPWLGLDGWPIDRATLDPHYARVPELLRLISPFDNEDVPWDRFAVTPHGFDDALLRYHGFQFGKNLLFGEVFGNELKAAENVTVLLNATVTGIRATERGDHVDRLDLSTLDGRRHVATARRYVLATGGIENARLLLLSDDVSPAGLGNGHDHVGRYFMEHPTASAGTVASPDPQALHDVFSPGLLSGRLVEVCLTPSRALMEQRAILNANAATRLDVGEDPTQALREILWNMRSRRIPMNLGWYRRNAWLGQRVRTILRRPWSIPANAIRHALGRPKRFSIRSVRLELRGEQMPNPDSRVTLGPERDALGQRRAHLHWALGETDWRTMKVMAETVDAELQRLGLGRLDPAPWIAGDAPAWPDDLVGGHHHMGTTRMSDRPEDGVVDSDLKCHGIDNLWIAGSSVFPTASHVNPTMTVLALSLRLADHLEAAA
ncbi:NAD(P)-binding protein [Rhodobacterales bacterium HKCCE2091]|nr:NAD(P)-binding protein [Rhodobacterales bacterium HKCCE2091]